MEIKKIYTQSSKSIRYALFCFFFFKIYLLERETECLHVHGGGAGEGERISSRLPTEPGAPCGAQSPNLETTT